MHYIFQETELSIRQEHVVVTPGHLLINLEWNASSLPTLSYVTLASDLTPGRLIYFFPASKMGILIETAARGR